MLYIESTNTIIRNNSQRYTHPITGVVYGGGDYENSEKLAEIGAVPLREEEVPEYYVSSNWEIVNDPLLPGWKLRKVVGGLTLDKDTLIAKAWNDANTHALNGMDYNSRVSLLWFSSQPDCPEWKATRINDVQAWWTNVWMHYAQVKAQITSGVYAEYDPDVAGDCPWTIWEISTE